METKWNILFHDWLIDFPPAPVKHFRPRVSASCGTWSETDLSDFLKILKHLLGNYPEDSATRNQRTSRTCLEILDFTTEAKFGKKNFWVPMKHVYPSLGFPNALTGSLDSPKPPWNLLKPLEILWLSWNTSKYSIYYLEPTGTMSPFQASPEPPKNLCGSWLLKDFGLTDWIWVAAVYIDFLKESSRTCWGRKRKLARPLNSAPSCCQTPDFQGSLQAPGIPFPERRRTSPSQRWPPARRPTPRTPGSKQSDLQPRTEGD